MAANRCSTLVHDRFPEGSVVYPEVGHGWHPLLSSLKTLLETGAPLNLTVAATSSAGTAELTPRQLKVLRLVAAGQTNVEIGAGLGISSTTVARHLASIVASLGVQSRAEAVAEARRRGLLGLRWQAQAGYYR